MKSGSTRALAASCLVALTMIGCTPSAQPGGSAVTNATPVPYQDVTLGDIVVHPQQESAPDSEGWRRATSTFGAFSIEVPTDFVDKMIKSQLLEGKVGVFHSLVAETEDENKLEFNALRLEFVGAAPDEQWRHVDELIRTYGEQGGEIKTSDYSVGDHEAKKFAVTLEDVSAQVVAFQSPSGQYILTVEGSPQIPSESDEAIERFFQSFRETDSAN